MRRISGWRDLAGDLRALGLRSGDGVFIHSALRACGPVIGGARAMVTALIDVLDPSPTGGGLIVGPGFSTDAYAPDRAAFDPPLTDAEVDAARAQVLGHDAARSSVAAMGAVAETLRTWPGARRSPHPTSSVIAMGPEAESLTARHPTPFGCGPDGPFGALAARPGMRILLLGVGWRACSALHLAEASAPNRRLKTDRFVMDVDGDRRWVAVDDVADDLGRLFPEVGAAFEATGAVTIGRVGAAEARLFGMRDLIDFATPWIDQAVSEGRGVAPGERR